MCNYSFVRNSKHITYERICNNLYILIKMEYLFEIEYMKMMF